MSVIEVAGLKVEPGTTQHGFIIVAERALHNIQIPFTVINGAKTGPTLCVTAAAHGTEYAGIEAAIRLRTRIEPQELTGCLIVLPVVNVPAFQERTYVCPIDDAARSATNLNLQGNWPGVADGSVAQQITAKVFQETISKAEYWIDLHGGDLLESEIDFSLYYKIGNPKLDQKAEELARAFGFEYVVETSGEKTPGSSFRVAAEHGIVGALAEVGQGGKMIEEEAIAVYEGILSGMRSVGMLEGRPLETKDQKVLKEYFMVGTRHGGLFYLKVTPGQFVPKGGVLGTVQNLLGEIIETVTAPKDGVVLLVRHCPVVNSGEKPVFMGIP